MRVLVTGGAGFIGSNLVLALVERGDDVLVADDLSTGRAENIGPGAELLVVDILDSALAERVAAFGPEVVVHLAAQSSVVASIRDPEGDRAVNVGGTRAVAKAARDAGARLVVSASSAAVYGNPAELPLREESTKSPINPYGDSKLDAEGALAAVLDGSGVDFASMRFGNVYGPRQDASGEGGVVAQFMSAASEGRELTVFGDGEQTRDFIYVGDVVAAVLAAVDSPSPLAGHGPAFNVSTGKATSVNALIAAVASAVGKTPMVTGAPERDGDIRHSVLDPSRAAAAFGWRASTGLEQGVGQTWRWWESR